MKRFERIVSLAAISLAATSMLASCSEKHESTSAAGGPITVPTEDYFKTPVAGELKSTSLPSATPQSTAVVENDAKPAVPEAPAADPAPSADTTARFLGLTAPKPVTWLPMGVTGGMRKAAFTIPGVDGADAAELIVFHMPGGTIQANIDRWIGQFQPVDGKPVEPKIEKFQVGSIDITLVELAGAYKGMGMDRYAPDRIFLSAIFDHAGGKMFIQLVGPSGTVEANRGHYMEFLRGLNLEDPAK